MTLYTKPINEITWDDVTTFCDEGIRENACLDYKKDFPKHLENTIAAMANTVGGLVLIGIEGDDENKPKTPIKGIDFRKGLSEKVIKIILSNVTPPFIPEITVCSNTTGDRAVVVVRVHESHEAQHAVMRNTTVYLRTGDVNNPETLATFDDIGWLQNRRRKSEQLRERLYSHARDRLTRFHVVERIEPRGPQREFINERLTFSLCPYYPNSSMCSPPQMRNIREKIEQLTPKNIFNAADEVATIVQDGLVLRGMRYHIELNCFGLLYYTELLRSDQTEPKMIRGSHLARGLREFFNTAIEYYNGLGYWGPLDLHVVLSGIAEYGLLALQAKGPEEVTYSPETEIKFTQIVLAHALKAEWAKHLFTAVQSLGWAFGLDAKQGDVARWLNPR